MRARFILRSIFCVNKCTHLFATYSFFLVPSVAPTNLRLVHRDSRSILVEWDPIPKGSENGVIKGYKVEYLSEDVETVDHETTHDEYTAVLSKLLNGTLYTIRVAAFTSMGSGDFSPPIQVRTNKCE